MPLKFSILKQYQDRHILLTGTTGFLGKVLLAMMLERVPTTGCIYILIRKNNTHSALDRFIHQMTTSPAFDSLHAKHRIAFSRFIAQQVKVIDGDITLPNLGIADAVANHLRHTLDLVINVAGLVDFFPDVQQALDINVNGALQVAEFVRQCNKAALLHISTCYVAGSRDGTFKESVTMDQSPSGQAFNAETEYKFLNEKIQDIIRETQNQKRIRVKLIRLGQERAQQWGWANTYCYAKALAEMLLIQRYPEIPLTIIRPSIIESAWYFPFPGWNEGLNTCAPMTYAVGKWYPFVVGRKNYFLDVIPIDYVTNAIILIGAAAMAKNAQPVYQLSSSGLNPLFFRQVAAMSRLWHRHDLRKNGSTWTQRYLQALLPLTCISLTHRFSPARLIAVVSRLEAALESKKIKTLLREIKVELTRLDKVFRVFSPFTHDYQCIFISSALGDIEPMENEFIYNIKTLNWDDYWYDIHMPGMNRWIYPLYSNKKISFPFNKLDLTQEQKTNLISLSTID